MPPRRKNVFGVLDVPRVQDAMVNAIMSSNIPNRYELMRTLQPVNRNFSQNLLLDDFDKMELYINTSLNPNWNIIKNRLATIVPINTMNDLTNWTVHDWAMHLTFSQYAFYLNKQDINIIEVMLQQFNLSNTLKNYNRVLMNYHIFMGKKNNTLKDIYNFFIKNFSIEQMEFIGY